jgi:hypothetical protein
MDNNESEEACQDAFFQVIGDDCTLNQQEKEDMYEKLGFPWKI